MSRIRVLVVDDAVVVRKLVTDVLAGDADLEVAGTAANGRIALQKIEQLSPDLVTLDVEMPEMDGLETIVEIRKRWPRLPVIMFSTLTERAASTTIAALARGASDYVTKPSNVGSIAVAQQRIRDELIPKIKGLCPGDSPRAIAAPMLSRAPSVANGSLQPTARVARVELLAIGASTGGPNALAALLPLLAPDFPVPIVITQHMPPLFTRLLADRLKTVSRLDVREAVDGAVVCAGTVLVAPGDHHLTFALKGAQVVVKLTQDPPLHSCRPAVDATFRSANTAYAGRVLAVVLTGMGRDGLDGATDIKRSGGTVFVQDEKTSVVWGMPGFIANAGIADAVLPIDELASAIAQRVSVGRTLLSASSQSATQSRLLPPSQASR